MVDFDFRLFNLNIDYCNPGVLLGLKEGYKSNK